MVAAVGQAEDDDVAETAIVLGDQDAHGAQGRTSRAEPEGQHRADGDGAAGVVEERVRDAAVADDRVAPVVEVDQLGEQLGAHPVAVAGDPVDLELDVRHSPVGSPWLVDPIPRSRRRAGRHQATLRPSASSPPLCPKLHWRWRWWSFHSASKTWSELEQLADGAVGMAARAATGDLLRPALEPREVVPLGLAGGDSRGRVGDRPEAEDARAALGGALAGHPVQDPGGRPDAADAVAEECDDAAAERGAGVAQRDRVERQAPRSLGADPAAEVAAEQDRLAVVGARAGARGPCQLRDRRADLDLVDAVVRGAGDGDQRGPGRRAAAGLAVPARRRAGRSSAACGEALDVLDERRAAADPALVGAWRGRGRAGVALVDEVDGRGLLAGDVRGRARRRSGAGSRMSDRSVIARRSARRASRCSDPM